MIHGSALSKDLKIWVQILKAKNTIVNPCQVFKLACYIQNSVAVYAHDKCTKPIFCSVITVNSSSPASLFLETHLLEER